MYGLYVRSSSLTCFCHFLRRSQEEGGGSSSGFNVVVLKVESSRVALHWRRIDKAMASSTSSRLASSSSSSSVTAAASRAATTAAASDDIYDFSGVANDLAILRSQLLTTLSIQASSGQQPHHHQLKNTSTGSTGAHASAFMTTAMATCKTIKEAPDEAEDDEEWYPPSPPVYDVTEKLIEVNRELQEDPTSSQHFAGKLRWKPDDNLVQIKWLYSNDCDHSGFISDGTEEEVSSSDECDGGGNGSRGGGLAAGLAAQLASELGARLCFTSSSSLYPPLPTIEDVTGADSVGCSQLGSVVSHAEIMADYDEDFEEPESLGHEDSIVSPMKDNDILTQISLSQPEAEEVSISSSSSESCRTVTTIRISRKDYNNSKETNNNIHDQQQRLQRPKMANNQPRHRTSSNDRAVMSSSVSQTSELIKSSSSSLSNNPTKPRHHHQQRQRSSSLPKSHSIVSNSSSPYSYNNSSSERGNNQQQLQLRKMQKVNHATIQANNNNNSCSSSEEGSTSRPSTVSSSPRALPSLQHTSGTSVTTRPPPPPSNKQHQSACSGGGGSNSSSSASVLAASSVSRKPPTAESRAKTKSSVYLNGNTPTSSSSSSSTIPNSTGAIPPTHNSLRRPTTASGRLQSRRTSIPPLHRKTSRNSLSSNSSVSSQTTEDSLSSNGLLIRGCGGGRPLVHHRHPSVVADVMSSPVDESPYFLQWKLRKREEKKLRARRSYLEQQMRRPY